MDQPIYWPARSVANPLTYQKAWESHKLKPTQGGHPRDQLESIFSEPDRVNDYTGYYPLQGTTESLGAQCSFSGGLIENIQELSDANQWGYGAGWQNNYVKARQGNRLSNFANANIHDCKITHIHT